MRILWILLAFAPSIFAQDAFLDDWAAKRTTQAPDIHLSIGLTKTTFYVGEVIPFSLDLKSDTDRGYNVWYPPFAHAGRLNAPLRFVADRSEAVDPMAPMPGESRIFLIHGHPDNLPMHNDLVMNQWLRFRQPGTYRVYAATNAVSNAIQYRLDNVPAPGTPLVPLPPLGDITSNVVTLTIVAPPQGWAEQQLRAATLEPSSRSPEVLAFLEIPESRAQLLQWASMAPSDSLSRITDLLLAAPDHAALLSDLRAMWVAPNSSIHGGILSALATLSVMVEGAGKGEIDNTGHSPQVMELDRKFLEDMGPAEEWSLKWLRAEAAFREEYIEKLANALPAKQADFRNTLQFLVGWLNLDRPAYQGEVPAWNWKVVAIALEHPRDLDSATRARLFKPGAERVVSHLDAPALESLLMRSGDQQLREAAQRRLNEMKVQ